MAEKSGKETPKDTKDAKPEGGAAAASPAKAPMSKKKKLLIVGLVAVVVLGGGGGAAWFFWLRPKPAADAEHVKVEHKKMPVFVELDQFTVNLRRATSDDAERYMQVKLVAEAKDAPAGEIIKSLMPAVRNEIILLLGSKSAQDVETREGKETLAKDITAAANKPLVNTPAEGAVEGINITHLIVQ